MANENLWAGDVAQSVEGLPSMHKSLSSELSTDKLGVEFTSVNPTQEVGAEESGAQRPSQLHAPF